MSDPTQGFEPFVIEGKIEIPYSYAAGRMGSRFLTELRDHKRILGVKCPSCDRVSVPPRSICNRCFGKLSELVEVSDEGVLETYATVHQSAASHHLAPPFSYGVVKLDGADSGFVHLIGEAETGQLRIGMRVKAVFADQRNGDILDIRYFKPVLR
jgi:uncharacterized OB-fold protein